MTAGSIDAVAYAALSESCAITRLPQREYLEATGDDRLRFINGLVTCDVNSLAPGRSVFGFFTSSKGRILAEVVVTATSSSLYLDLPGGRADSIAKHVLRYKVADRVEIAPCGVGAELSVGGPRCETAMQSALDGEVDFADAELLRRSDGMMVSRDRRLGVPAVKIAGSPEEIAELEVALEKGGVPGAGPSEVSSIRVERGVPWFGVDYGDESLPQETGLEDEAVSLTKGCYLGQEIVARIHYRGHINRRIVGLSSGTRELSPGEDLLFEGEVVGGVTSAAWSPSIGGHIGLATVHRKASLRVALVTGESVALVDLPFALPARR